MISDLPEQECFELLTSTTVGRLGFTENDRIQIFPVNYSVSGRDLLIRTSSGGSLSRLGDDGAQVAFEIDYHDDLAGSGWSVLMHGELSTASPEGDLDGFDRVSPWAGDDRAKPLRFRIDSISGRRVRRDRH
ncbi:pyridoxamine 5'-phosphate oxidase family protein [Microbacterium sp.]|uniref:pyridoxamine 5'-phosphate oxidase family protein n=1 Tax=Microbacterium sp. TaxID=51671 RepID=UPI003A946F55